MSTTEHPVDRLIEEIYREDQARAAGRIAELLEIEGAARRRVRRAVAAERRRNRRAVAGAVILTGITVYNLTLHGFTFPWL